MTTPTIEHYHYFFNTPVEEHLRRQAGKDIEREVLGLFQRAAAQVPAYGEFLRKNAIRPVQVTSLAAFAQLPLQTKIDYMRVYPLAQRCYGGTIGGTEIVAVSSGSTGEPMFWPRTVAHEMDIAYRFEQVLKQQFECDRKTTLAVICFTLGNWVGGVFTLSCCRLLAQKGLRLTIATPGNNVAEIMRVLNTLGGQFEQTVLFGYPPFLKTVLDAGSAAGFQWGRYNIKMVFAGEVFSEEWRTLITERLQQDDAMLTTATLYGTADGGVLGNETPFSIVIRRYLAEHPGVARELFGESRLPTLVQYDPLSRYFEVFNDTLVVTGEAGVPLVRYHIADKGGIIPFDEMMQRLRDHGFDAQRDAAPYHARSSQPLPFVYLFGRADFTVSYFGANVYPENVTTALEQHEFMSSVSGKFVMETAELADGGKDLRITIELLPKIEPNDSLRQQLAHAIKARLLYLNSEYANYVPASHQLPQVVLKATGDAEYFPAGIKHRYTRK